MVIDINCDMGEGMDNDEALMPYITSANIACGYHAGDEYTIKKTIELCLQYNVQIGAHPSYPDKQNFGRLDLMDVTIRPDDLPSIIIPQLQLLQKYCAEMGTRLYHVKPHGALYNRAAWDGCVAGFICSSILEIDDNLILYGLSGSEMMKEAKAFKLKFLNEVFADRTYQDDGSLTPRSKAGALIDDKEQAVQQVLQMVQHNTVKALSGKTIPIVAQTVCVHGDGAHAVAFAQQLHTCFKQLYSA